MLKKSKNPDHHRQLSQTNRSDPPRPVIQLPLIFRRKLFFKQGSHDQKIRDLERKLVKESDFTKWCQLAKQIDTCSGRLEWRNRPESTLYDHKRVRRVIEQMQNFIERTF